MTTQVTKTNASIDLTELKSFCRIDGTAHDGLLATLVAAAFDELVNITHWVFGTGTVIVQTWQPAGQIDLPICPAVAITEVLVDDDIVDTANWQLRGQQLVKVDGELVQEKIKVTYTVGEPLPADLRTAIYQRVKYQYDYGDDLPQQMPRFFDRIAFRYRNHQTFAG